MGKYKHIINPFTGKLQRVLDDSNLGDMLKSVYDIDNNGIVDNSEKLEGASKEEVQDHSPKAHTHEEIDITDLEHDAQKIKGKEIDDTGIDTDKYLKYDGTKIIYDTPSGGWSIVTVGTSGADYDNFDDAIDYLRTLNGGTIIVTSNMTITSTTIKDLTNISIEGDLFFAGMRQINKTATFGYWYGKNVIFKDIVLFRMSDTGANEIFRFTEDYQDVTLRQVTYVGLSAFSSPAAFNCNGKEAHVVCDYICGLGTSDWGAMAFSNVGTLVLQLRNRTSVYLTGELDACWYDGSCKIEGNPTWNTPDHPILTDKEQLLAKNSISGTFTTTDGKTITVADGQITNIA